MSGFKAKIHQIYFPLAPPGLLAIFKGPTFNASEGRGMGREGTVNGSEEGRR